MTRSILVPLDGSAEAEAVLPEAARIAPAGSKIYLLHQLGGELKAEKALEYLERIRTIHFPRAHGIDLVRSGEPADGILRTALEKNIDLIAMTTHARRGLSRLLLGSVASEVVRKSQLPVLLTRPDTPKPPGSIRRIVLPIEGAEAPSDILETVKALSLASKAEIILVHVTPPVNDPAPQWALEGPLSFRSQPERRLQDLADALEEEGFTVWPVSAAGKPAEEILRQATRFGVDLVALSTHARTGLERIFEGSVAEKIVREAPVAVLLQRPLVVHKRALQGESHA